MDRPLEEELTLEMIPEGPYRSIAEAVGVGSLLIITEMLGGAVTYPQEGIHSQADPGQKNLGRVQRLQQQRVSNQIRRIRALGAPTDN